MGPSAVLRNKVYDAEKESCQTVDQIGQEKGVETVLNSVSRIFSVAPIQKPDPVGSRS